MSDDAVLVKMEDVGKSFGTTRALDGVSLQMRRGQIVGLIGPNGSGKSTLLRHVVGLHVADRGRCTTLGADAPALDEAERGRIGYVDQEVELLGWMRVDRHIDYVKAYHPAWNDDLVRAYLERFAIPTTKRVAALSPGVRQQLAVVLAIGNDPELLVLDEPAAAMDPIARANFLDLLLELIQDERRAIVISSHILTDVEKIVDRVVIMRDGRILRDATLDDLRDAYRHVRLTSTSGALPAFTFPGVVEAKRNGAAALLSVRGLDDDAIAAAARGIDCIAEVAPLALDDIYRLELETAAAELRS